MKIKKTLRTLIDYLSATRQVGHTTAMIRGAQNVDSVIVLTHTQHHADLLQKQLPSATVKAITNPAALVGMNKPLLVDNATLWDICGGALTEIERLEHRVDELREANEKLIDGEPEAQNELAASSPLDGASCSESSSKRHRSVKSLGPCHVCGEFAEHVMTGYPGGVLRCEKCVSLLEDQPHSESTPC